MKGAKLNLLLFVVVLLLVGVVMYQPGIETEQDGHRLLPMLAEDVTEIAIHNGDAKTIRLKREPNSHWHMVEPLQVAANRHKVDTVLDILKQEPNNRFKADRDKLGNYGLQNPQVRLVMKGSNDAVALLFGAQTPLNSHRYLQLGDEVVTCRDALMPRAQGCAEVATIDDKAFYPVASIYTNFIASRLLPEGTELASIQLPDFQVQLKEGRWILESHNKSNEHYTADQLAQWIDGWRYASSVDIESLDERMQSDEMKQVVITLRSGEQLRWRIVSSKDALILGRSDLGIEYHMSRAQRDQLMKLPEVGNNQERNQ